MSEEKLIEVVASPTFNRNIRTLAKKYRSIRSDVQPIIEQLESGELPGEQIQGTNYTVFKLRVRNSNIQKGKSGGYRLIYYLKTATGIILLTIYTKSEQADIAAAEIKDIIADYEQSSVENIETKEDI
ncbi:MAG: type II toxin-antitoxin system RelE/ParE family toxin [Methylacidiphilales bacterium]|nr:type II toxin-antitoxin system RelE/ParE family toxin [Candidatus Methylacidiphilales bacterium]NJR15003.1 type II toxin-antitoxin system RelE/ParE family toxin [Calothrix sp. CSU_2_0]